MSVGYRRAVPEDWPQVSALRLAVRENRLSDPAKVTQAIYDDYVAAIGRGWVAEADGGIIGFAIANRSGLIWALFVAPGQDGRGIGQALLARCVAWLGELGLERAFLETGADTRAEAFYRRGGWRETGRGEGMVSFALALPVGAGPAFG